MNTLPNPLHGDWADSMADWAVTHQPLTEAELDRFIAEMHPPLPQPAEACTELGAEPPPRVVDTLRRRRAITAWLAVTLAAVICGVCLAGYLRVPA